MAVPPLSAATLAMGKGAPEKQKALLLQGFLSVSEATVGLEPTLRVLQTLALPLGDVAGGAQCPDITIAYRSSSQR